MSPVGMKKHKPISEEEIQRVAELCQQGRNLHSIASELGRGRESLLYALAARDLTHVLPDPRKPLDITAEQRATIVAMGKAGKSRKEIAKALGVTRNTLFKMLRLHGLEEVAPPTFRRNPGSKTRSGHEELNRVLIDGREYTVSNLPL